MRIHCITALIVCLSIVSSSTAQTTLPDITVAPLETLRRQIETTINATRPDFVVFVPTFTDSDLRDTGNEHFIVFDGPDGSLMAVWTQSTREADPDQHIVFSRSVDAGKTWRHPRTIAGPGIDGREFMSSWGFPLVSKSGRIYVLYFQNVGKFDTFPHHTAWLEGIYSDDHGTTWSAPERIEVPRTSRDNPDTSFPPNMLVWQKPVRLTRDGRYLVGASRWTSKAVKKNPTRSWISHDSVVEFMRFENVDDDPPPGTLKISFCAWDNDAITVPYPGHPQISVVQEPSIVKLPDGRLFCVMRTSAGSPYWTMSSDDGTTWSRAQPLLRKDDGERLLHPLAPCPIYDTAGEAAGSGKYVLFIHNHDGNYKGFGPMDTSYHRRPIYLARGRYVADAKQPVWFDEPQFFFDHDDIPLGAPGKRGNSLAIYGSVTYRDDKMILWYPDRKFFLLGKYIPPR